MNNIIPNVGDTIRLKHVSDLLGIPNKDYEKLIKKRHTVSKVILEDKCFEVKDSDYRFGFEIIEGIWYKNKKYGLQWL